MQIRIRNFHIDGYGHVHHPRYLEFLEEARWAFFEQHNLMNQLDNIQLVVARADIRYRRAAVAGDLLDITNRITAVSARHIVLHQQIAFARNGTTAVEADITLMPVDAAAGCSTRLPEILLTFLRDLNP